MGASIHLKPLHIDQLLLGLGKSEKHVAISMRNLPDETKLQKIVNQTSKFIFCWNFLISDILFGFFLAPLNLQYNLCKTCFPSKKAWKCRLSSSLQMTNIGLPSFFFAFLLLCKLIPFSKPMKMDASCYLRVHTIWSILCFVLFTEIAFEIESVILYEFHHF